MRRARGYAPFATSPAQDALLDRVLEAARRAGPGDLAVLDLDGCLFDTRPRQVAVLRRIASREGWTWPARVEPEHILDWDLRATLRRAGAPEAWLEARYDALRRAWFEGFFADDAPLLDHPMPGAARLVRALARHLGLVYLSGRHEGNRAATLRALALAGFPGPEGGARLVLQPGRGTDYAAWKRQALDRIEGWGRPALFLDNEPDNVNLFRERYPEALVVFVETDHSARPVEPAAGIPWLRGFLRTGDVAG